MMCCSIFFPLLSLAPIPFLDTKERRVGGPTRHTYPGKRITPPRPQDDIMESHRPRSPHLLSLSKPTIWNESHCSQP
ncbi:hypothetical protein B0J12DRAFT_678570 [Macrophomina phaseolina]|uniref:Secreted protein n=1 Tax=Macrophomina phaseolina TaxID=35725 RepID=A0ABQ8FYV1_9PEZI|nr:hypothetical protein B0J12DRAFT_678570 [Macrophomina phaseolina]